MWKKNLKPGDQVWVDSRAMFMDHMAKLEEERPTVDELIRAESRADGYKKLAKEWERRANWAHDELDKAIGIVHCSPPKAEINIASLQLCSHSIDSCSMPINTERCSASKTNINSLWLCSYPINICNSYIN